MTEEQLDRQIDRYNKALDLLDTARYAAFTDNERMMINEAIGLIKAAKDEVPPFPTDG